MEDALVDFSRMKGGKQGRGQSAGRREREPGASERQDDGWASARTAETGAFGPARPAVGIMTGAVLELGTLSDV